MFSSRRNLYLAAVFLLISTKPLFAKSTNASISAKAGVVVDKKNNRIVYAKNPALQLPMASTTKIMTALLALENLDLKSSAKISLRASQVQPSKVYLRSGEEWLNLDLLYALLMSSANDAAISLAEEISGNEIAFVELMNIRARQLHMLDSKVINSSGLSQKGQYSSCLDLTKAWRKVSLNPVFLKIMRTKNKTIASSSGRKIFLRNHNKLLWGYPQSFIGKTGYTLTAKHCFVGELNLGRKSFIIAILGSKRPWGDLKILADYCRRIK